MSDKHANPTLRAATAAYIAVMLDAILPPIREVAHHHGYAVAVHGSLARDIDLIAVPWREEAAAPQVLAASVSGAVAGVLGSCIRQVKDEGGTIKPYGRRAFLLIHSGFVGEIDLSVMPPVPAIQEASAAA